jgi:3-deoxy-manno-octulosonate cytidylyltransferase (CMP-KDO synthetase)
MKPKFPVEALALIIPARMGAQRLPRKPLAEIGGVPLIVKTAQQGQQFLKTLDTQRYTSQMTVATDHPEIFNACKDFHLPVVMTDRELPSGSDRVLQAAAQLKEDTGFEATLLLNLQGDEPFMPVSCLTQVIQIAEKNPDGDLFTAAKKCRASKHQDIFNDPNAVKVVTDSHGQALYFSRAPIPHSRDNDHDFDFLKHMGVYLWKRKALTQFVQSGPSAIEQIEKLEQLRAMSLGQRIFVAIGEWDNLDINTAADLRAAENFQASEQDSEEC